MWEWGNFPLLEALAIPGHVTSRLHDASSVVFATESVMSHYMYKAQGPAKSASFKVFRKSPICLKIKLSQVKCRDANFFANPTLLLMLKI